MEAYEYKVLKIKAKNSIFSSKYFKEDYFDDILNDMGRKGWTLIDAIPLTSNGTVLEILYHFSRPAQDISRLV